MGTKFCKLLDEMKRQHITKKRIAEELGISSAAVSWRFCGKTQWKLGEMHKVLNLLGAQSNNMAQYFPTA